MKKEKRTTQRIKSAIARATKRNLNQFAKAARHRIKLLAKNAWEKAKFLKLVKEKTLLNEDPSNEN